MKFLPTALVLAFTATCAWGENSLTALEREWLASGGAVLDYAQARDWPVDIIIQPDSAPTEVPVAMGFDAGRCKLVFSLRGNPDADAVLSGVAAPDRAVLMEAMVAHEIAHCWRHLQGKWRAAPAGFTQARTPRQPMQQTRREEGLADLAGLSWTLHRHPARYARVHAWFQSVREDPQTSGGHHDTRVWIDAAASAAAFTQGTRVNLPPFERAEALWSRQSAE